MHVSIGTPDLDCLSLFAFHRLRRRLAASDVASIEIDCRTVREPSLKWLRRFHRLSLAAVKGRRLTLTKVQPELKLMLEVLHLADSADIREMPVLKSHRAPLVTSIAARDLADVRRVA